jgi:hypothetical protein
MLSNSVTGHEIITNFYNSRFAHLEQLVERTALVHHLSDHLIPVHNCRRFSTVYECRRINYLLNIYGTTKWYIHFIYLFISIVLICITNYWSAVKHTIIHKLLNVNKKNSVSPGDTLAWNDDLFCPLILYIWASHNKYKLSRYVTVHTVQGVTLS